MLGIGISGEPELFLRLSLLFNADSIGCCGFPAEAVPGGVAGVGRSAEGEPLSIEMTDGLGLKVTFRGFRCASNELTAAEGSRGELSVVELEAIAIHWGEVSSEWIIDVTDWKPWDFVSQLVVPRSLEGREEYNGGTLIIDCFVAGLAG